MISVDLEQALATAHVLAALSALSAGAVFLPGVTIPTCDVADEPISNGGEAKCFADSDQSARRHEYAGYRRNQTHRTSRGR